MLIRRLRRVYEYKTDGWYAKGFSDHGSEPQRVGPALKEDEPFTDVIRILVAGRWQYFIAEVVGAPRSEPWLTTGEAASAAGVTRPTIRNWIKLGKVKAVRTAGGDKREGSWHVSLESLRGIRPDLSELDPGPAPERKAKKSHRVPQLPGQLGLGVPDSAL